MGKTFRAAAALGLAVLSVSAAMAQRDPPPLPAEVRPGVPAPERRDPPPLPAGVNAPAGVEVQARGPVHEAFAEPGTPPSASPVVPKQPPAPVDELPPDQKPAGEGVQWISGYWQWDDETRNFLWVSGCWRVAPPGYSWLPGRWQQVSGGWQWESGSWVAAGQTQVQLLPPPPAPKEEPPLQVEIGQVVEPGCWIYRANRYAWRPAFAVTVPRNWVWVSAQYTWTPLGCIFVEGHWDYPVRDRGLLFAPVVFTGQLAPAAPYVPRYVVREDCLLDSLFVRTASHHYYFGDYFENRYEKQYIPWTRYRLSGSTYDPLFAYYRQYAGERGWEQSIQSHYSARYEGREIRPPRTFIEQERFVRDGISGRRLSADELRRATILATLAQYQDSGYKLDRLSRQEFTSYRASSEALRQFGRQFQQRELQVYSDRPDAERFANGPVFVKWEGHPHGGPPGQLKKSYGNPPRYPGRSRHDDDDEDEDHGHKGDKRKGKGKK